MPGASAIDPYLAANLIGFTTGLVISVLLLVLTLRAAKLPGTPVPNVFCAVCSLMWNLGGLVNAIQNPVMKLESPGPACTAMAIQFSGAAVWPIAMVAIWRRLAVGRWQCVGWRALQILAVVDAAVIVLGVWASVAHIPVPLEPLKEFTSYSASLVLVAGAAMLLRGSSASRAIWFSSLAVLCGVLITTLSVIVQVLTGHARGPLGVTSQQSVLLVEIGSFFLFARFRFADLFIRYSVRILLASTWAIAFVLVMESPLFARVTNQTEFPRAVHIFATTILATGLFVGFAPLDRRIGRLVNRWIFHAPDHRNAARELGDKLRSLYMESDLTAAVEEGVRNTLVLSDVRSVAPTRLPASLWPTGIHDGEVAELDRGNPLGSLLSLPDVELLVPVRTAAGVVSILAISPGPARRSLVSQEVNYLRSVAAQFGGRLDLLRLEREMADRQNREALLLQQVTEAELRALRAQINPHFLFNSLNTIANLIVTNPALAETMTLRLSKVFRHVLAQSSQPVIPIRDEIEFVRTYLEIEEARFGTRLQVEINVSPEAEREYVPSLILQPVVENALKHGLAPKPGPGRLWISAKILGDRICLQVEDDGVGPSVGRLKTENGNGAHTQGVGLTNVRQRLATLYQDRAWLALESREPAGARVTLVVPRDVPRDVACAVGSNGDENSHS
jgi:two-component system, LytTR family, sensor kinase